MSTPQKTKDEVLSDLWRREGAGIYASLAKNFARYAPLSEEGRAKFLKLSDELYTEARSETK